MTTPVLVVLPDLLLEGARLQLFPDELDNAEARDRGGGAAGENGSRTVHADH